MNWTRTVLLWLSGLAILALLIRAVSPAQVGQIILETDLTLLAWAAMLSSIATLLGAFNSYLLVSISHNISLLRYCGYFWMAWAFGLILPGQVGDIGIIGWMMKRNGMQWTRSLGRLIVDKLVSLGVISAVAVIGLFNILGQHHLKMGTFGWLILLGAGILVVLFFLLHIPAIRHFLAKFVAVLRETLEVVMHHPGKLLLNATLTVIKVLILAFSFWLVCLAVGMHALPFWLLLQLMAIASLIAYLPLSINGVGTVELASVGLFSLFGFETAIVLAAYLVTRVMTLTLAWLPTLAGMGVYTFRRE